MFDYNKLLGKIKEVYGTQGAFAEAMGVSLSTINLRLNGKTQWKAEDIDKARKLLHIQPQDTHLYFFTPKVVKTLHEEA